MFVPDHDPVASDLAEDLPRRFASPGPFPADDEALEMELARWGLAGAFPPLVPPPDPRDAHALFWAWALGLAAAFAPAGIVLGCAIRWALGLPALGP